MRVEPSGPVRLLSWSFCAVTAVVLLVASHVPAKADPSENWKRFPAVDELRTGVFTTNLEDGSYDHGRVVLNGEVLFGRLRPDYANPIQQFLLNPRPHLGISFNPHSDGVSEAYAGLTWDYKLSKSLFVEGSFGGTVHDGDTASYGCSVLFRESASLGVELTEHVRLMGTVDHASNAGLCSDNNKGLTNAGVRLGYRW